MGRNLLVTGDESVLLTIRNTYMKRLIIFILMVVLSMPTLVSAHNNGNKKHKRNAHTNNGKHKGWYKDGHKRAHNDSDRNAKRLYKKKNRKSNSAPYGSGTYKKPTSTVADGGVAKNTGGSVSIAKNPTATTNQGGVSKGSGTMSNTGGAVKASGTTSSQGGASKN